MSIVLFTTILLVVLGIIVVVAAFYLIVFVIAFIYNGYLIASGKMSREDLAQKVAIDSEKRKKERDERRKKRKERYERWLSSPTRFPWE